MMMAMGNTFSLKRNSWRQYFRALISSLSASKLQQLRFRKLGEAAVG